MYILYSFIAWPPSKCWPSIDNAAELLWFCHWGLPSDSRPSPRGHQWHCFASNGHYMKLVTVAQRVLSVLIQHSSRNTRTVGGVMKCKALQQQSSAKCSKETKMHHNLAGATPSTNIHQLPLRHSISMPRQIWRTPKDLQLLGVLQEASEHGGNSYILHGN